ncbi:MAG: YfiR family protein [Methylophilaceae bacterium]
MAIFNHCTSAAQGRALSFDKLVWIGLVLLLGVVSGLPAQAVDSASEDSLKAAVVYNIPLFVEWPAETKTNFNFCVYGKAPLLDALRQLEGKSIRGRKISVLPFNDQSDATDCHAFVILNGLANPKRAELISKLQNKSILIIADDAAPPPSEVMINLLVENGKIIFEANPELAKSVGLKLSSKLLRLAKVVYPL